MTWYRERIFTSSGIMEPIWNSFRGWSLKTNIGLHRTNRFGYVPSWMISLFRIASTILSWRYLEAQSMCFNTTVVGNSRVLLRVDGRSGGLPPSTLIRWSRSLRILKLIVSSSWSFNKEWAWIREDNRDLPTPGSPMMTSGDVSDDTIVREALMRLIAGLSPIRQSGIQQLIN